MNSIDNPDSKLFLFKNYQFLDTGYRLTDVSRKKRFREVQFNLNNIDGYEIPMGCAIFVDDNERKMLYNYSVNIVRTAENSAEAVVTQSLDTRGLVRNTTLGARDEDIVHYNKEYATGEQNMFLLDTTKFEQVSNYKVRIKTSGKGYSPRAQLLFKPRGYYELFYINWVYRSMSQRQEGNMADNSNETVQVDDGAVVHTSETEVAPETQTTTVISPEAQALLDKIVSILTVNFNRKIAGSVLTADMYNKMNDMLIEAVNQHDASIQALKEYILTYVPNFVKIHISDSAEESTGDITDGTLVIDVSHLLDSLLNNIRKECKEYTNEQRKETETGLKEYTNEYVKQYVEAALIKAGLPIEALTKAEIDAIFDSLIIPDNPSEACSKLPNAYESHIGYFDIDNFDTTDTLTVTLTEVPE